MLKKLDVAKSHEVLAARTIIRSLNADAPIIATTEARAPLTEILDAGSFSFEKAATHATWPKELNGFKDHKP